MVQLRPVPRFVDSWASIHLDTLRAAAAMAVLLEHWRNLLFIDYPQLTSNRLWLAIPYRLSGCGHQAVVCFFVLSGYFIGGTVLRAVERGQWSWRDYLLRRLVRLWLVLLPSLLLCLLWDRLGIWLGHAPGLYAGRSDNHMIGDVRALLSPGIFLGNALFVQNILTPVFGSDGALWSLAYEFWYYLLFPLGLLAVWPRRKWRTRLLSAALLVLVAAFVGRWILASFPIWLAGVLLYKVQPPVLPERMAQTVRVAATLVYLGIFFTVGKLTVVSGLVDDYLLTLATFAYVWLLLSSRKPYAADAGGVRLSRGAARFSFTLYTAHTPLLVLLVSLAAGDGRWAPGWATGAAGLGMLLLVLGFCWLLAMATEFRTDQVRSWIERRLGWSAEKPGLSASPLAGGAYPKPGP